MTAPCASRFSMLSCNRARRSESGDGCAADALGGCRVGKFHRSIVYCSESEAHAIERIVLIQFPRRLAALLGELVDRALDIARGKIDPGLLGQRGILIPGGAF